MTAVEWLFNEIIMLDCEKNLLGEKKFKILEQAKEMEKQQIKDAYDNSYIDRYYHNGKNGVQYYKETFKNK